MVRFVDGRQVPQHLRKCLKCTPVCEALLSGGSQIFEASSLSEYRTLIDNKIEMEVHLECPQIHAYVGISIDRPLVCSNHFVLARPKSEPRKSWARFRV